MGSRLELQALLETLLGSDHVYFQPPPSVKMIYPCIKYTRDRIVTKFADNNPYSHAKRYTITVIDSDPDSLIPDKISELPTSYFDRNYVADNLKHDVFNVYY